MKPTKIEKDSVILISSYAIFSTGINAKGITNIIFASPLKSFVAVTQSIGRAIRTHISKTAANIYDLSDAFTPKGTFMKQLQHRIDKSYKTEGFPIYERTIKI